MNDLRFAFRQLLKNPGFTAVAIVTLALGIGANTAIFSIVDAVLLRLLPVRSPEQLLALRHAGGDRSGNGFSYPVFENLRDRNRCFSDLFAFATWSEATARIGGRDEPLPGGVLLVSGNYFSALGIRPYLGRLISPDDNRVQGGHPVAVLSHGYWQRTFGGDPSIIGRTLTLNGVPFSIIGISPPAFFGVRVGRSDAITVPIMMEPQMMTGVSFLQDPRNWDVEIMGRLNPGETEAQAMAGLKVVFQQIELEMIGGNPSPERQRIIQQRRIELSPASQGLSALRQQFSEPLKILMAVTGMVLLIACANVANLLLARAWTRQREISVRLALGASRGRIVRQLLTESVLLALLGGAAGVLIAKGLARFCIALIPDRSGSIELTLPLDGRLLAFASIVSMLTGIVFGLLPALQSMRTTLAPALKGNSRVSSQSPMRSALGKGLVVTQVAMSLVLLIAAGLFLRTFAKLQTLDAGFNAQNLMLFSLDMRMRNAAPDQAVNLTQRILERLSSVPGIVSATLSRDGTFGGGGRTRTTLSADRKGAGAASDLDVFEIPAGPRFFETFGIRLLRGREFTFEDDERSPKVAILNEATARHFFGTEDPLGRRIGVGTSGDTLVVGVAGNTKVSALREEAPRVMYRPLLQSGSPRRLTVALRTAGPPMTLQALVRRELDAVEPNLPLFGFTTQSDIVWKSLAQERLFAAMSSLFGLVALALAAVGIYGVLAYHVRQRTREIGVRMALGAARGGVLGLVIGQGMKVVGGGLAAGLIAAIALTRLIASHLYGISPTDPLVVTLVVLFLCLVGCVACYLPARQATQVDPVTALRTE